MQPTLNPKNAEPRWPALIASVAIGGLYAALPAPLLISGPRWLLIVVIVLLLVPTIISHRIGHSNILLFASWYWRLDAGGPHERARTRATPTAFLGLIQPGHSRSGTFVVQMLRTVRSR